MFDFTFDYRNTRTISVNGIDEVVYYESGFETAVSGEDILTHKFPINVDLQLKGKDHNCSVSHDGLLKINVTRAKG